jgi:hypothetical protein
MLTRRPSLELLEDRLAPSVNWINPAGGDWDTGVNWSTGVVPVATDDVVISQSGITVTHAANMSESINSLTSQANIDWQNGSLTLDANSLVSGQFSNEGSLVLQAGSLNLAGGGTSSGSIAAAAGTSLRFGGTTTLTPGSQLVSGGTVLFNGTAALQGTYNVGADGATGVDAVAVDFSGTVLGVGRTLAITTGTADFHHTALTLQALTLGSGLTAVLRAGDITVTSQFDWTNGTISGPGTRLTVAAGAALRGTSWVLDGRTLDNYGTAELQGDFTDLALSGGAVVNNYGTFRTEEFHGSSIQGSGTGELFNNYGSLVEAGTGSASFYLPFNNSGTVNVPGGSMAFNNSSTDSGSFTAAAGTSLAFNGTTILTPASQLASDGSVGFDGYVSVQGTYNVGPDGTTRMGVDAVAVDFSGTVLGVGGTLAITNGVADFSPAAGGTATVTVPNLAIVAGSTLSGTDNFVVTSPLTWSGAIFRGDNAHGSLTVAGGMTVSGNGSAYDFAILNPATTTFTGGNVSFFGADSSFTNTFTGTFDDQVDGTFGNCDGNCANFVNEGLFLKSGGRGTTNLQMDLVNSGKVVIQRGSLNLGCGYVQAPPSSGGSGGTISGSFTGTITNPGQLDLTPASTPPPVVTGYTQTVSGVLNEQIGGYTAGTQYGQIIVNGSVNLAGGLQVALINGFKPVYGNQFTIIDNQGSNPINGTFTNLVEGTTVWDSTHTYRFTVSYVGSDVPDDNRDVVLTAQQTATTIAVAASANPSVLNQPVTFTATVTPAVPISQTPTGTVQFQIDGNPVPGTFTLSGGSVSFSTPALTVGTHTITATYSGDGSFLTSSGNFTQTVYSAQQQNSAITMQLNNLVTAGFLSSGNGTALTVKLNSATASLNATPPNNTAAVNQLNAFINQVTAFQKTGKLASAQAQSLISAATLAINAIQGTGAKLQDGTATGSTSSDSQPVTDAGQLVTGAVGVYLDNADGTPVPADEQARFDDAIATLDTTFGPFGVDLVAVGVGGAANAVVQVEIAGTSAAGGAADGVLGCTVAGQITLLTGWNWYTGADPSAIGAGQYDFETIVMHELGHAIGLGHSGDTNSVMYAYLAPGQTHRVVTTADLSVLDSPSTAPHALLAAPWHDAATSSGSRLNSAVAPANAKERPARALVPINPALANALALGSANIVVVQPAAAVESTVNQANISVVGTIASVRQHVAVDQFFVQIGQNATTNDSSQPERLPPVSVPETNLLEENAQPVEPVPASDNDDDYGGLLGDAPALEEPGTAMWLHACDACFADDDWSPRSETIAAGSLIAVGMAANPTLLDNLVRLRSMHGRERNNIPALAKR